MYGMSEWIFVCISRITHRFMYIYIYGGIDCRGCLGIEVFLTSATIYIHANMPTHMHTHENTHKHTIFYHGIGLR